MSLDYEVIKAIENEMGVKVERIIFAKMEI